MFNILYINMLFNIIHIYIFLNILFNIIYIFTVELKVKPGKTHKRTKYVIRWRETKTRERERDQYIYIYLYIWMVELKVLVRSFTCESHVCYVRYSRESFPISRKNCYCYFLFAKVLRWISWIIFSLYTLQLAKGYRLLPPRGQAGEWYRTFTFPFIGR